ncbi:MAG: hypothetical protein ACOXZR_02235 [Bacilli bacterium]|jgi:hypothetical protein
MIKDREINVERLRKMIMVSFVTAVFLLVITYAWFVGMFTVSVNPFEVEIAATESLLLSLDGKRWYTEVTISKDNLDEVCYEGHTNKWGGEKGLKPLSTVGEVDKTVSRLIFFEKASLTASPGGYRLLASRVDNFSGEEADGYVVFDLFIKNFSGDSYESELNEDGEEAIYLSLDSSATIADEGIAETGIENSVRVAFALIGRVMGSLKDDAIITSITCHDNKEKGITGICRDAQIWEPNDDKHVSGAINWYTESCRKRIGHDITKKASFSGPCKPLRDGISYQTYAVKNKIKVGDNVDIYDGPVYNGYSHNWAPGKELLYPYPYFTDTMKELSGIDRPDFLNLAPNSITKVRVYVYIEGQDIDNYEFAAYGKKISVNFGFTKQKLTEEDIYYEGPGNPYPIEDDEEIENP